MIWYFYKKLYLSIQVQLDNQKQDLDLWDKVVERAINVKVKASFQLPSRIIEIDFKCPKGYKSTKQEKDKTNWEH